MKMKKHWSLLTTKQKRHRIFQVTQNKDLFFWGVCGKEKQHYYTSIVITDDNVDTLRELIYEDYMICINKKFYFDKADKIERIQMLLSKGKYEILHNLEIEH